MGRGKPEGAGYSHQKKHEAYNERKKGKNYPKGGYGVPHEPYAGKKRSS